MTLILALVSPAWQEALTGFVTDGNRLDAAFSWAAEQVFDLLMARGTVDQSLRVAPARLALARVAHLLALVMRAVKRLAALFTTRCLWLTAKHGLLCLTTEALLRDRDVTRLAWASMAVLLAPVDAAVQDFVAHVSTGVVAAASQLTRHVLLLLPAVAGH